MKLLSETKVFNGQLKRIQHTSESCRCEMTFAIFLPAQANQHPVPVLYWLSGLTCTDENFMSKAGAQQFAAKHGIAIVAPDTSPRGLDLPKEHDDYDFGSGAGFYLNATTEPWHQHYNMYDYVVHELPRLVEQQFPVNQLKSISGHSMGGHGALTVALKNSNSYQSVSAFAPICAPIQCPWGVKAFSNYLGDDKTTWQDYDSCALILNKRYTKELPILVDQGSADNFLQEQLKTELLKEAAEGSQLPITINMREGYDHSYYFIASFMADHLDFHAHYLLIE